MTDDEPPGKLPAIRPRERRDRLQLPDNVISLVPRTDTIQELVRRLAVDTANIKWSTHALERMVERGITDKIALEVMRRGFAKGDVEAGAGRGEWKIKMAYRPNGRREVGVVVITVRNARLFVKTVEWEDVR